MASRRTASQLVSLFPRRSSLIAYTPNNLLPNICLRCIATQTRTQRKAPTKREERDDSAPRPKFNKRNIAEKIIRKAQHTVSNSVAPMLTEDELNHVFGTDLFVFRCDLTSLHLDSAMRVYPNLRDIGLLNANDISNLARQVHTKFRLEKNHKQTMEHLEILMVDLKKRKIRGHPLASVHILSCLKDMEEYPVAQEFWGWLENQEGDEHIDSRVYGAMIEVLAFQGEPIKPLEEMYHLALEKYATTQDEGGGTHHRATRLMLLQGIITARILHKRWRNAYDALDTCLYLHPMETPTRIFELFIFQRPIEEAYIVFLMACRCGSPPSQKVLTSLLKTWNRDTPALIRVIYSYVGAGGQLTYEHMNNLIYRLLSTIPNLKNFEGDKEELEKVKVQGIEILSLVKDLIHVFKRAGVSPSNSTFNTIITVGQKLGHIGLVHSGLSSMISAGVEPNLITYRCLLNAFGEFDQPAQVRQTWEDLCMSRVELLKKQHMQPSYVQDYSIATRPRWETNDWKALVNACVRTNQQEYLEQQIAKYAKDLQLDGVSQIRKYADQSKLRLYRKPIKLEEEQQPLDGQLSVSENLKRSIVEIGRFKAITSSATIHNFSETPLDFEAIGVDKHSLSIPKDELMKIYESFMKMKTTKTVFSNSLSPSVDGKDPGTRLSSGLTIGQLRFENWMAINKLLYLAQVNSWASKNHLYTQDHLNPSLRRPKTADKLEGYVAPVPPPEINKVLLESKRPHKREFAKEEAAMYIIAHRKKINQILERIRQQPYQLGEACILRTAIGKGVEVGDDDEFVNSGGDVVEDKPVK